jgi:zinc transporter ZupT
MPFRGIFLTPLAPKCRVLRNVLAGVDMVKNNIGIGAALGVSLGTLIGAALHNIGAGIAVGVALGAAIGLAINGRKRSSN